MTVSDEQLAAYADGELSDFEAAQVRRAVAADPALARQLEQLQDLKLMLSAHFDPVLAQPVPDRLTAPIAAAAKVVDLGAVRAARRSWLQQPALRFGALPALAAALVLVIFVGRGSETAAADYAPPQLAAALGEGVSGQKSADGTKLLLSFRDTSGNACRAFSGKGQAGIACHDAKGWKLVKTGGASSIGGNEYQQAGNEEAEIMAAAQDMAAGDAMTAEEEAAARGAGWAASK